MKRFVIALALLAATLFSCPATANVIQKTWDWSATNSSFTQTLDEGGFPAGSVVIISFTAKFPAFGTLTVSEYGPASERVAGFGLGCERSTSISTAAGDFNPKTAVTVKTGVNQGIGFQAGGNIPKRVDKRSGKVTYLVAPLEVGKAYFLNVTSTGAGCGNIRVEVTEFPIK